MSPQLALLLVSAAVICALALDWRRPPRVSPATLIPLLWIVVLASRPLSQWTNPDSSLGAGAEDGSLLDRTVLSALMAIGLVILIRRGLRWSEWISENKLFLLFFLFCGISVVWSDFPLIGLKRWVRAVGGIMMILIILSEKDPIAALAATVRRCGYVLVPLSVLMIKYFREQGVVYDGWTGEQIVVGITTDKNALGRLCLLTGLFAAWELVTAARNPHIHRDTLNRAIGVSVFLLTLWLLQLSDSKTALVTLLVGCAWVIGLGLPVVKRMTRFLGTMIVVLVVTALAINQSMGLAEDAAQSLGRNLTLTDRTFIWQALLNLGTNPVLGVGYDTFWLGSRLRYFIDTFNISEAHNGYLEVYLELGLIGLFLFGLFLLGAFQKAKAALSVDFDYGRLRVALLTVFMMYNITESGYKVTTAIFWVFLLSAIDVPALVRAAAPAASGVKAKLTPRAVVPLTPFARGAAPHTFNVVKAK
jgi:O-antigen ligase